MALLRAAVSKARNRCFGFQTLTDVQQNLTFQASQLTNERPALMSSSFPSDTFCCTTQEIFGTFMLCFTVWECAVTPVGGCGKNVCLAKLGSGKWYEGSWMSSDWKKQLLQEMVLVFCCQSQESQRICDGFHDYIILCWYCNCIAGVPICWKCLKVSCFTLALLSQFFPIVHKDWRCSFCECADSATSLLDQSEKGPGTSGTWHMRRLLSESLEVCGIFQKMILKPIWYL